MTEIVSVSRRRFLQGSAIAAGGLLLGFHLPGAQRPALAAEDPAEGDNWINAYLRIAPDGTTTILVGHSEMGQGVYTALPMLIAEELGVDWQQVRAEMAPAEPTFANQIFNMQATGGSTSVRASFEPLRKVGAAAREMLKAAAAERWGVDVAELTVAEGRVHHQPSDRSIGYGELAEAAGQREAPQDPPLKPKEQWTLIGTPAPRLDVPPKVDGSAVFGMDVQLDGMLVGTVINAPVFGGKLKSVDEQPALAVEGVQQVVPLEDGVIVLADGYWPALQGAQALEPQWEPGEVADLSSARVEEALKAALEGEAVAAHQQGEVEQALKGAARVLEATYRVPYVAHATMEPMNATVHIQGDRAEAWVPTQAQSFNQQTIGSIAGIEPDKVKINTTFLGGGFGRRFEQDFVAQAAQAAKAAGRPVKLIWSREQDMRHDFYRPAAMARFRVGLDDQGNIVAWENRIVSPSIAIRAMPQMMQDGLDPLAVEGASDLPYSIPNQRIEWAKVDTGVPVGFWRSVGHSYTGYLVEAMLDEVARAAGRDPLELRLALLKDNPRHAKALETAAGMAGWGEPAPEGRQRGLAVHQSFGSIVAEVAEVSLEGDQVRVHKVHCAVDCGTMVNPDTVRAQMESAIAYGLSAALLEEITFENGRVVEGNFDTYPVLKLDAMPQVEVEIIESGEAIGGIGEPGTPPIAPAVVNAILAATGNPVRSLPIRLEQSA